MSMTIAEARSEILGMFTKAQEIEGKYPDGIITNNADETEVKRLLGEIDGLEAKLSTLEAADQRAARLRAGMKEYGRPKERYHQQPDADDASAPGRLRAGKTPGDVFVQSQEYEHMAQSGAFKSTAPALFGVPLEGVGWMELLQHKALVYSGSAVAGSLIVPDRLAGITDILQRQLNLLDLIPTTPTTSDHIEYVREDTNTNNAAPVAEATVTTGTTGSKPESALALSKQSSPVETIAEWMAVTNKMLADAPAIQGLIDSRLVYHLRQKLEDQILSGNGTTPNLGGILNAGIQAQGVVAPDSVADAVRKAMTKVRVTGLAQPNVIVFHPNDWESIRLLRENSATGTLGGYLLGPPNIAGPATLWGLPVVESLGMTENTVLIGDFQLGCMLFDREQPQIRTGTVNDDFIRNMFRILAELRAAFVVFRPNAFCRVTGA